MNADQLSAHIHSVDPVVGLRAVGALRRLAEQVEAVQVRVARQQGWTWEQIGDALGVSRQSVHAKYRE
ncbi:helix-turn-helix domain-containing protein [Arthrobacter sp. Bi83]|uniref:helix-turn-helix domain-containing protein n=1 Tax=Arthrobacter sp. Bi83 TaxID=2822353 RepID=UPI001E4AD4E0|nr:helix-turn-helix domain-containing protein [Arthrobacter sp. Bi83]